MALVTYRVCDQCRRQSPEESPYLQVNLAEIVNVSRTTETVSLQMTLAMGYEVCSEECLVLAVAAWFNRNRRIKKDQASREEVTP